MGCAVCSENLGTRKLVHLPCSFRTPRNFIACFCSTGHSCRIIFMSFPHPSHRLYKYANGYNIKGRKRKWFVVAWLLRCGVVIVVVVPRFRFVSSFQLTFPYFNFNYHVNLLTLLRSCSNFLALIFAPSREGTIRWTGKYDAFVGDGMKWMGYSAWGKVSGLQQSIQLIALPEGYLSIQIFIASLFGSSVF